MVVWTARSGPAGRLRGSKPPLTPVGVDSQRFDGLFADRYAEVFALVYRIVGERMDTEDIVQETFVKLADDVPLQSRPDAEVAAWLRRVGVNLAFNRVRTARRA